MSFAWQANREAIVAQLRQAPLPDIVILDLMLPDISGFECSSG
jgi:DNA-binding response OmpR family regulator